MASQLWLPVDDEFCFDYCTVEGRADDQVELKRANPPSGVSPMVVLSEEEAEKLLLTLVLLPVVVIGALLTAIVTAAVEHYLRHHPIKTR